MYHEPDKPSKNFFQKVCSIGTGAMLVDRRRGEGVVIFVLAAAENLVLMGLTKTTCHSAAPQQHRSGVTVVSQWHCSGDVLSTPVRYFSFIQTSTARVATNSC